MTSNNVKELQFRYTNEFYIYLQDKHRLYMLFGNNVACFDFILNKMAWRVKLYDSRRPMYVFINYFFQNEKFIYIGLPNEFMAFDKTNGTKVDLVTPKMMKKKERIKDVVMGEEFYKSKNRLKSIGHFVWRNDHQSRGI
jgi:hypothetical protein